MKTDYQKLFEKIQGEIIDFMVSNKIDEFQFKNTAEGFRSVLEYMSGDINSRLKDKVKRPQFPVIKEVKDLTSNKFLSKVKSEIPDVYKIIEGIQPFKSDDKWLEDLSNMTNDSKHNSLPIINEEKAVIHGNHIKFVNSDDINIEYLQLDDKIYKNLEINGSNVKYDNMDKIKSGFTFISDNVILYQGTEFNAIKFLTKWLSRIAEFIKEYEKIKYIL